MSNDFRQEMTLSRRIAVATMCVLTVAVLAVAITTDNGAGLVQEAVASDADVSDGYFPAQFPTPQTPVEPHIEAF